LPERLQAARRQRQTCADSSYLRQYHGDGSPDIGTPESSLFIADIQPAIDIKIKDAIGRLWQCSTIQVDFNLPERFDMEYISAI
jgi:hypothetical protein